MREREIEYNRNRKKRTKDGKENAKIKKTYRIEWNGMRNERNPATPTTMMTVRTG